MRKAIGCLLLAVMCLLGSLYLPRILQEIQTDQDQQNLISGYVRNPDTTTSEETDGIDNSDEPASENNPYVERSIDFPNLQQINPEIFAWITVPGTPIDYPVALGEDNNYYLYHSVTGENNILGAIFAAAGTDLSESHIILYGHNMASGKMFGSLKQYHDKDFRNTYPYVLCTHQKLPIPARSIVFTVHDTIVMYLRLDIRKTVKNGNNGLRKQSRTQNMTAGLLRPETKKYSHFLPA